jgi:hypothetical protein
LDIGTKNDSLDVNVDQDKPSYDINIIKYGQKPVKEADNAWVSVVIVGLLILTISGILFAIRQVTLGKSHNCSIRHFRE